MSVGIDVGSKSVKVIELAKSGSSYSLRAAGVVPISFDIEQIQDEKQMAEVSGVIKKLMKDARVSTRDVNLALPETQVYSRVIKFPLLTNEEISSAVKWEAEEYVPIPLKDAVLQYQILERREVGNPPQVLVLVVAALKSLVEKYITLLSMADLNVVSVETELIAMARSLGTYGKVVLMVDLGAHSTDIAIVKESQLYFSRSIPTAGDAFTRAVAQVLNVSSTQAEEYKRTYGLTPDQLEGKVSQSLLPILKSIVEEVKKSIQYFQMDIRGELPTMVVLSGGGAGLPGVATTLTKMLGMEVVIANPFTNISVDPAVSQQIASFSPLYAVATGLAERG